MLKTDDDNTGGPKLNQPIIDVDGRSQLITDNYPLQSQTPEFNTNQDSKQQSVMNSEPSEQYTSNKKVSSKANELHLEEYKTLSLAPSIKNID